MVPWCHGAMVPWPWCHEPCRGVLQGPVRHGPVRHGPVRHGPVRHEPVRHGPVRHGPVRHGPVRHGPVRHGPVRHGPVQGPVRHGPVQGHGGAPECHNQGGQGREVGWRWDGGGMEGGRAGGRAGWELGTVPLFFIRPTPLLLNEFKPNFRQLCKIKYYIQRLQGKSHGFFMNLTGILLDFGKQT